MNNGLENISGESSHWRIRGAAIRPRTAPAVADIVRKFQDESARQFVTLPEARCLATALGDRATHIRPRPEAVVGIAAGGVLVAHVVASGLGVPCHILRIQRRVTRWKQRVGVCRPIVRATAALLEMPLLGPPFRSLLDHLNELDETPSTGAAALPIAGKAVLLVDDCIESGQTMHRARRIAIDAGAREVSIAVISWAARPPLKRPSSVVPDVHLNRLIPYFPWSRNSPSYPAFEGWLARHVR